MTRRTAIDTLIHIGTGFTIAHGLLSFLIVANEQLYDNISLHYSNSFMWYLIFFFVPLLAGLIFYFWLRHKNLNRGLKILFGALFVVQLAFTVIVTIFNSNYWGYAFKRPAVFHEILDATKILTCSSVSNNDSTCVKPLYIETGTTESIDNLYGRRNLYNGTLDRIFMVFQDGNGPTTSGIWIWILKEILMTSPNRTYHIGNVRDFPKICNNPEFKVSKDILLSIDKQIQESKLIVKGERVYYDTLGKLDGIVTEFVTGDNVKYLFAGLSGREVSNDHYPQYEFLFVEKGDQYKLIKKQRFYRDIAGIEGLEYANIAPFFSLLLTAIGLIGSIIIVITNRTIGCVDRKRSVAENVSAISIQGETTQ